MDVRKVIRGGKVAVLYSPGHGAGWSTWADELATVALFSPEVVAWVESGKVADFDEIAKDMTGGSYFYGGGAYDLKIAWLPIGTRFRIDEYDGHESIALESDEQWIVA